MSLDMYISGNQAPKSHNVVVDCFWKREEEKHIRFCQHIKETMSGYDDIFSGPREERRASKLVDAI